MEAAVRTGLRSQLTDRKRRVEQAIERTGRVEDLVRLLGEIDSALGRLESGNYGECEICHEAIDAADLAGNPLIRYCLCALSEEQQNALQNDLDLAGRIQAALLPRQDVVYDGWQAHYRYQPAGPVSGDYCDLLTREGEGGGLYFAVADVAGKGVAASLLMAHLNASFRNLIGLGLSVPQFVERANRLFSESTLPSHYATLAGGRASVGGLVEICNAGHCPPLLVTGGRVERLESTGFPIGIVRERSYEARPVRLDRGDILFLYTDGLTEARDGHDTEFGLDRLGALLLENHSLQPRALADLCLEGVRSFLGRAERAGDLTMLIIRRDGGGP